MSEHSPEPWRKDCLLDKALKIMGGEV